jgi:hypothetical protein
MTRNASFYVKTGGLILFCVIILGYSFFQFRNLIFGPQISVELPLDGQTYLDPLIEIKGSVTNVSYLGLDDRPIFTDTSGNFDEKILLSPGYNIIKIDAQDKFGKKSQKILQIIYKGNPDIQTIKSQPSTTLTNSSSTKSTSTVSH